MANPESYSYLQVGRPVIQGGEKFVNQVRLIGERLLGSTVIGSISEPSLETIDDSEIPDDIRLIQNTVPVTMSRLKVCDSEDLRVVLFQRKVPTQLKSRYSLAYHAARFESVRRRAPRSGQNQVTGRTKFRMSNVQESLERISDGYGLDYDNTPVILNHVDIQPSLGRSRSLLLFPEAGSVAQAVLLDHAEESFRKMESQSKKIAYPDSPGSISIPFAEVSSDVSPEKQGQLIETIQHLLPVRFAIGRVAVYQGQHS